MTCRGGASPISSAVRADGDRLNEFNESVAQGNELRYPSEAAGAEYHKLLCQLGTVLTSGSPTH